MKKQEVSAELWERVRPLLPVLKPTHSRGGRPRIADELVLDGVVFVLRTGIPWEELPQDLGCGQRDDLLDEFRHNDAQDYSCMRTVAPA